MANYPSSASTDANLYVAVNSLATSLAGALTSSGGNNGSDIEVVSTAGFPATGFITIDQEAISYTSLLSTPPRFSGITRGADGTIASAHSGGSTTKHNVIAAHHNVLKEEVKAIETDLLTGNPPLRKSGGTMTGVTLIPDGSLAAPSIAFSADTDTGIRRNGSNFIELVTGGSQRVQVYDSAVEVLVPLIGKGTTTNDNASNLNIGAYVSSVVGPTTLSASVFTNVTSISLTAGDWDVTGCAEFLFNTNQTNQTVLAVSINSGNTTTDHVGGSNSMEGPPATSTYNTNSTVANYRLSLSSTTTVYLKGWATNATTQCRGRLSARRVR